MAARTCVELFSTFRVPRLKEELRKRGASTRGKKAELLERLEAYERNKDFRNEPIILPPRKLPDWPKGGFKQLLPSDRSKLPPIHESHIKTYIEYRQLKSSDNQAIPKGQQLMDAGRVEACSMVEATCFYFSGIVRAAMKKKWNDFVSAALDTQICRALEIILRQPSQVTYSVQLKFNRHGEIENSACECTAGKGPHGTCKHIAALSLVLETLVRTGELMVSLSCTDVLQTFHTPQRAYTGSPIKASQLGQLDETRLSDPRPAHLRNMPGYNDHVRSLVLNYCSAYQEDLTMRYLYTRADIAAAVKDHAYCELPYTEYWVDRGNAATTNDISVVEAKSKDQGGSRLWRSEREWRLTASTFGTISSLTSRRNMNQLCDSILNPPDLKTDPILHGKQYEPIAIEQFQQLYGVNVLPAGLTICEEHPFLGATPDGFVGATHAIEVKCAYTGREEEVRPHSDFFPYLHLVNGATCLKESSKHYAQIQGQLAITKRETCYFIVHTFKTLFVQKIKFDKDYWQYSLLPKLSAFYSTYYRPYVSEHMY